MHPVTKMGKLQQLTIEHVANDMLCHLPHVQLKKTYVEHRMSKTLLNFFTCHMWPWLGLLSIFVDDITRHSGEVGNTCIC